MKNFIDARGLDCPHPVIFTKEALDKLSRGTITVIVDNEVAKDNVIRLAQKFDYPVETSIVKEDFYIKIEKNADIEEQLETAPGCVVVISSEYLGRGSDELGRILTKSLFFALIETEPTPEAIIFLNSGVKLTCEESHILDEVEKLSKQGAEILSCGTCLDYFGLKDKLCVGRVSNIYEITDKMLNSVTVNL